MIDQVADPRVARVLRLAREAASAPAIGTTPPARILELLVRRPGKAAEFRPARIPRARLRRGKPIQSRQTFVSYQILRGTMPMGRITATELPSRCCLSSQEVPNCHFDRREISTCFDVISSRSGWRTYSIRCKSFGFDSRPVQERKGTRETGPL